MANTIKQRGIIKMKILIPDLKYRLMWAQKYNVPLMDGQLSQDIKVMHQTVQEFAIIRIIAERLNRVRYVKIFHSNPNNPIDAIQDEIQEEDVRLHSDRPTMISNFDFN